MSLVDSEDVQAELWARALLVQQAEAHLRVACHGAAEDDDLRAALMRATEWLDNLPAYIVTRLPPRVS